MPGWSGANRRCFLSTAEVMRPLHCAGLVAIRSVVMIAMRVWLNIGFSNGWSVINVAKANRCQHNAPLVLPRTVSPLSDRVLNASPKKPPLHQRVGEANLATLKGLGKDAAEAILDDIRRDRDAAYARLAATSSSGE